MSARSFRVVLQDLRICAVSPRFEFSLEDKAVYSLHAASLSPVDDSKEKQQ